LEFDQHSLGSIMRNRSLTDLQYLLIRPAVSSGPASSESEEAGLPGCDIVGSSSISLGSPQFTLSVGQVAPVFLLVSDWRPDDPGEHDPIVGQQSAYLMDKLRAVRYQPTAYLTQALQILLLHRLLRDKPDVRSGHRIADRVGIVGIVLLRSYIKA
jgi:hypothetical protein